MTNFTRKFTISGNNNGLACPFESITCQEGYCRECQIYLDWQRKGEMLVMCAWCGKVKGTKPGYGETGISNGICAECAHKHSP